MKEHKYRKDKTIPILFKAEILARSLLIFKYGQDSSFHDIKIINDIIFNEETHFVAIFKEYLIYEEMNEFLKRFYFKEEIKHKMPKILMFYEKYSKIYANYTQFPESKYMYKNIKKKQKMIDKLQEMEDEELEKLGNSTENYYSDLFTTKALDSINSITLSINKKDSSPNTESSLNSSFNNIINKINSCEKDKQNNNNKIDKHFNNNNKNIKIATTRINKNINYKNIPGTFFSKKIYAFLSPKMKPKAIDNSKNQRRKINYFIKNIFNLQHKISSQRKLRKDSSSHRIKPLLSTNSSRMKTERIISTPKNQYTTCSSKIRTSNRQKYNSANNSHAGSSMNNNNKKYNSKLKSKSKPLYHSKIFSNRNSYKSIYSSIGGTKANTSENKSKSTPKNTLKGSYSIINNVNIINNIQSGSTQINIYNYNDLLRSLHLNNGSILHSSIIKKNSLYNRMPLNCSNSKSSSKSKKQNNIDLNLRKLLHKNIAESECSTERYSNNNPGNLNGKFGKNQTKMHSAAMSKNSTFESKLNSGLSTRHPSMGKMQKNHLNNNNNNLKISNNEMNDAYNIKLRNLSNLNNFMIKNNMLIHSERSKKSKISFK